MTLKRKVRSLSFFIFLFFTALFSRAENKFYPLDIDVAFSPCPCNGNIYLFSKSDRNQTLNLEENAPNCNLFPLNPLLEPLCFKNKVFIADKKGQFYFLSNEGIYPSGTFSEKILGIHILNKKLYIIFERVIKEFENSQTDLPFVAISSFGSENGILVFGEKDFIFLDKSGNFKKYSFPISEVKGAAALEEGFVICGKGTIFFLNKKGKVFRKFTIKSEVVSVLYLKGNKTAVATSDHFIRVFDRKGIVLWQYRLEGIPVNLILTKNGILTASKNGTSVVLIDPVKGTELWSHKSSQGEIYSLSYCDSKVIYYSLKENLEWVLNVAELPD